MSEGNVPNQEAALDKIDIASELKTLSPIEKRSIELKKEADAIEIKNKDTYVAAKKIKKALISHRTGTKDLRLTFTRKLDNLKDQFIKKQDEVLQASLEGETLVKEKIAVWEKLEAEKKAAEEARIDNIQAKIILAGTVEYARCTTEDVKRARAAIKMELSLLDQKDRNKVAIKTVVANQYEILEGAEAAAIERERLAAEAETQRIEREKLDADRKQLDADKSSSQSVTPKIDTYDDVITEAGPAFVGNSEPVLIGGTVGVAQGEHTDDDPFASVLNEDQVLFNRIKGILSEDITGQFQVRWFPINEDDHDSWIGENDVKNSNGQMKYRDMFAYIATQIIEVVKENK